MRKLFATISLVLLAGAGLFAQEFNDVPRLWKWVGKDEVAFTYDGSFKGEKDFVVNAKKGTVRTGISYPAKYTTVPIRPQGAVNLTFSPDSTMLAFTRNNDLWVVDIESGKERRLTYDGSDLILNGYASWVYYEEILGRASNYRSFWWSPDSKYIGFYRYDNTRVPMFPIYSPKGQDGSLRLTRYPKCGEENPEVSIGMVDVSAYDGTGRPEIVWADFDPKEDQYFGTPFWGDDSKEFFISREPRLQNTLDLYSVSPVTGAKKHIYHEQYKTWLDWISGMVFTSKGLYMVREFETGWQQIYFLSYDGNEFRRLTDGPNWRVTLQKVDEKTGDVYFIANRESTVRKALYKVDAKGTITPLTDSRYTVSSVRFSDDGNWFVCSLSNFTTPERTWLVDTKNAPKADYTVAKSGKWARLISDSAGPDLDLGKYAIAQNITMTTSDGLVLPAYIIFPKNFDPSKKYPVHMDIYGGPDTPQVSDRWMRPSESNQWWSENGIIEITADCRASGHNGRLGLDQIYRQLDEVEVKDFVQWAEYLKSLPYVNGDKIGVEGFSFGGTMTSLLVMDHPDAFHYGIAGGGVYDWALYDTHYTERFMDTPQANPEGYERTKVINHAKNYPVNYDDPEPENGKVEPVMLKITHGTGDDNVHFQNTLQLVDELMKEGKKFELMIYPDGMHGYRGYQGTHFQKANREFWLKYLKGE